MQEVKLKPSDIQVGRYYVKHDEFAVRKVWQIEGGYAYYLSWHLYDGKSFGDGCCSLKHLAKWTGYELTDQEKIDSLEPNKVYNPLDDLPVSVLVWQLKNLGAKFEEMPDGKYLVTLPE